MKQNNGIKILLLSVTSLNCVNVINCGSYAPVGSQCEPCPWTVSGAIMVKTWPIGIYGISLRANNKCEQCIYYFDGFARGESGSYVMIENYTIAVFARNYLPYCSKEGSEGRITDIIDLYHVGWACRCKNGYYGNTCELKVKDRYYARRGERYCVFRHHKHTYHMNEYRSMISLAQNSKADEPPTTVVMRCGFDVYIFTKPWWFSAPNLQAVEDFCKPRNYWETCDFYKKVYDFNAYAYKGKFVYSIDCLFPYLDAEDWKKNKDPEFDVFLFKNGSEKSYLSINYIRMYAGIYTDNFFKNLRGERERLIYNATPSSQIDYEHYLGTFDCIPRFYFESCFNYWQSDTLFYVDEEINIRTTYKPNNKCNIIPVIFIWDINRIRYDQHYGTLYSAGTDARFIWHSMNIFFVKYYFRSKSGIYRVTLTITLVNAPDTFHNTKTCYLNIHYRKLTVQFKDGPRFQVDKGVKNRIEVVANDPNDYPGYTLKNVKFTWSCTYNRTSIKCNDIEKYLKKAETYLEVPSYTFKYHWVYKLKVRVHADYIGSELDAEDEQELLIIGKKPVPQFLICCGSCFEERKMVVGDINYILVKGNNCKGRPKRTVKYSWKYTEMDESQNISDPNILTYNPANDLRVEDKSNELLFKIKRNVLSKNKKYIFVATEMNGTTLTDLNATLIIETLGLDFKIDCTVTPESGVRGLTEFDINCGNNGGSVHFEFYDKDKDDQNLFSGRMLGYGNIPNLSGFKMTRGTLVVLAFNQYKTIFTHAKNVQLTPFNETLEYIKGEMIQVKELTDTGNNNWALQLLSSMSEVIQKDMDPDRDIISSLLLLLGKIPLINISPEVKLVLSSLHVVLSNTVEKFKGHLETEVDPTLSAATTLLALSDVLSQKTFQFRSEKSLKQEVILEMAKMFFDCADIILQQNNIEVRGKTEETANPFVWKKVQQISFAIFGVLEQTGLTVEIQQIIGDSVGLVESNHKNIILTTMVDYAYDLSNWTREYQDSRVKIPLDLTESVALYDDVTSLQYLQMNTNPFWWEGTELLTQSLLVTYRIQRSQMTRQVLSKFKSRIALSLGVTGSFNSVKVTLASTYQLDSKSLNPTDLDINLPVYKFYLPPRAKLYIEFLFSDEQSKEIINFAEYRVWIQEELRPDYDEVVKHSTIINSSSDEYKIAYESFSDREKMYYMGILPSVKYLAGDSVPFRLKAYYIRCITWIKWKWTPRECWVGKKIDTTSVQCDCDHLSMVDGELRTVEHKFDPFSDFVLFLTPSGNILPLILLVLILFVYFLLLFLFIFLDDRDTKMRNVIVLDDNFPGERYGYLVGVYTGARYRASTTSVVGIRMFGEKGETRSHVLTCQNRRVLSTFSDDWFLIYSPHRIGKLIKIVMWHNNNGSSPDWYLDKIEVYDLKQSLQYLFVVKQWMSVDIESSPELTIMPVSLMESFDVKDLFVMNFMNGMRDKNVYTSLALKHPRDPVKRVIRLSGILLFVLVAMAVCIVLYVIYFKPGIIKEDLPLYEVMYIDLIIFAISFLAAWITTRIVIGLFRKSYSREYISDAKKSGVSFSEPKQTIYEREQDDEKISYINESEVQYYRKLQEIHLKEISRRQLMMLQPKHMRKTYENMIMAIHKIARCQPLLPVTLPQYKLETTVSKFFFFLAWALFGIISILCVIVVLFFGWRLPTVKTEHFLYVFVAVVLFDALVISVLSVLFTAAILSIMFQNVVQATAYKIDVKDGNRKEMYANRDFLQNVVDMRSSKTYLPLDEMVKNEMRRKKLRKHRWNLLLEFKILIVLLVVLILIIIIYSEDRFNSNYHATLLMTVSRFPEVPSFKEVSNQTIYVNFLEENVMSKVYKYHWYNVMSLSNESTARKDWMSDSITRRLGNIRIRQLRVRPITCGGLYYFENATEMCAPQWSQSAEDQDVYGTGWSVAGYKDLATQTTTWKWSSRQSSNSSHFYGSSGTLYHAGGYIADLGSYRAESSGILRAIEKFNWFDHMTRALFLEMTLYNVNTNLFTQVVLVTEQTPFGLYINLPKVVSVTRNIGFNVWNLTLVLFLVYFFIRSLLSINHSGVFVFLSSLPNVCDVLMLSAGFGAMIVYIMHVKSFTIYIEKFHRSGLDQFFNFFQIYRFDYFSRFFICLFFTCLMFKVVYSFRFSKEYYFFYQMFTYFWLWTVIFVTYLGIVLWITWRFIGYRINVYLYSHYTIFIMYYKHFKILRVDSGILTPLIVYITCALSGLVMFLLLTSYVHLYKSAKKEYIKYHLYKKFIYLEFLRDEITKLITILRNNKSVKELLSKLKYYKE